MVTKPTGENKILDLVPCSDPGMVEDVEVGCPVANSDHSVVEFKIVGKKSGEGKTNEVYSFYKGIYEKKKCIK